MWPTGTLTRFQPNSIKPKERILIMMKKTCMLFLACLTAVFFTSCGITAAPPSISPEEEPNPAPSADADETGGETLCASWLPAGAAPVPAEADPFPELAKAIAEAYEIPEDAWNQTKYYYNYVDLNDDGADEIFAVAIGPYTSGSGGDSGMWLIPYAGMSVSQTFTLIRMPILVSDTVTNGAHELIVQRSGGGGETECVRLVCTDGIYSNPADSEVVEDISGITGTAILSNDLLADLESGSYLTLEDAKNAA
jgi:hypothetical protein